MFPTSSGGDHPAHTKSTRTALPEGAVVRFCATLDALAGPPPPAQRPAGGAAGNAYAWGGDSVAEQFPPTALDNSRMQINDISYEHLPRRHEGDEDNKAVNPIDECINNKITNKIK